MLGKIRHHGSQDQSSTQRKPLARRPRSKHFFIFAYAGESVLDLTCVVPPE